MNLVLLTYFNDILDDVGLMLNNFFMFTFRSGDPQRGLRYLNRAHDSGCEDEDLFVIRCQCHLRLGNFGLADKVYTYHIIFSICTIIILYL